MAKKSAPSSHSPWRYGNPSLVAYFGPFKEPERSAKALKALKLGVIWLQAACPTLDTLIVKDQFAEMQKDFREALARYFAEKNGIVPRSLNDAFGEKGALSQFFQGYFDPKRGRLVELMNDLIGPSSKFAKQFDPKRRPARFALRVASVSSTVVARRSRSIAPWGHHGPAPSRGAEDLRAFFICIAVPDRLNFGD
jgi:hypothetical protein